MADDTTDAAAVFKKRILPIFNSPDPSSCTECHLSSVELKNYIHSDQAKTFAALRDAGLVDVKHPEQSKILKFIARRPKKPNLITQKVRDQELAAFRAWLGAAVRDEKLLAATAGDEKLGPQVPDEVIRHGRMGRVLESFIINVWSEAQRCAACHSPDKNQKHVEKHGEQVSWITLRDPQETMWYLIDEGLIDDQNPGKSLLLTKPTMQVDHKGGKKMEIGDRTYKQFRRFIDDYADLVNNRYQTAADLPPRPNEISVVSEHWLKVTGIPERFDKMLLRTNVHIWNAHANAWSERPLAAADRLVFGAKGLWQNNLSLLAKPATRWAQRARHQRRLPAGKYRIKLYLDREGRSKKDYKYELGQREFVGQVDIQTHWPRGYGRMTVIKFPQRDF